MRATGLALIYFGLSIPAVVGDEWAALRRLGQECRHKNGRGRFCTTTTGAAPRGTECAFPFNHSGQQFQGCAPGESEGEAPWCFPLDQDIWDVRGECHCEDDAGHCPALSSPAR